jgi:hypothetical protein
MRRGLSRWLLDKVAKLLFPGKGYHLVEHWAECRLQWVAIVPLDAISKPKGGPS